MYDVSKCAPQEALRDLDMAKKRWFKKQARKPRFKKRGRCRDSYRMTGAIKTTKKHIQLPKVGKIRTKEDTSKLKGRILSATISRSADRWFCSLRVLRSVEEPERPTGKPVGIDLGIKSFVVDSNKEFIKAPKPLKAHLKKLQRLSRQLSRKEKGSRRRRKAKLALAREHARIHNIRMDFLHKISSHYAKTTRVICLEDLHVAGMVRNHCLARAISDVGMGYFRAMLEYKCAWYRSHLVKVSRWFPSSKQCCRCKHKKDDLKLSNRIFRCSSCGLVLDRDLNAAKNILIEGLESSGLIKHYPKFQGKLRSWRSKANCCVSNGDLGSEKQVPNVSFG